MSDIEGREQAFAIIKRFLAERVTEALDDEINIEIRHLGREPYTLDSVTISTKAALDPSTADEILAIASDQAELCSTERDGHRFLIRTLGSIGGARFELRTANLADEDPFDDEVDIAVSSDPISRWVDLLVLQERNAQVSAAHDHARRDKLLDVLQTMVPQVLPLILERIGATSAASPMTSAPMTSDERAVLDRIVDGINPDQIRRIADSGLLTVEQMVDLGRLWTLTSARRYGPGANEESSPRKVEPEPVVVPPAAPPPNGAS